MGESEGGHGYPICTPTPLNPFKKKKMKFKINNYGYHLYVDFEAYNLDLVKLKEDLETILNHAGNELKRKKEVE